MQTVYPSGGNDTAAIQTALNTGQRVVLTEGNFTVTDALTFKSRGQIISGQGQRATKIRIPKLFNMAAQGVFVMPDVAMELRDLWVAFDQPDTNVRANLVNYPPAIYAVDHGFTLWDCSITQAMNGINMTGNCGQTVINMLNMSAYGTGIMIDGSMDTVRIDSYHFWPYEMTANQQSLFYAAPTRAFSVGRVDGLVISKFLNISNLGLYTFAGATGRPWIYISDSGFDTFNGIQHTAGQLQINNSYVSLADSAGLYALQMSGAGSTVMLDNCLLFLGPSTGVPAVKMLNGSDMKLMVTNAFIDNYVNNGYVFMLDPSASGSIMKVSGSTFNVGAVPGYFATAPGGVSNKLHLHDNYIDTIPHVSYGQPMINVGTGVRSYIVGNRINDKGNSAATFVKVAHEDFHMVTNNMAPGWLYSLPTSGSGFYGNNI